MYYERVKPILGTVLDNKVVGIVNAKTNFKLLDYLASCGIKNFKLIDSDEDEVTFIKELLTKHNTFETYDVSLYQNEDLDIITGILEDNFINKISVTSILGGFYEDGSYFITLGSIPEDISKEKDYFNYLDLTNQVAKYVIAKLLENTSFEQKEVSSFLEARQTLFFGNGKWSWYPFKEKTINNQEKIEKITKKVLIIGCGSLGSTLAVKLAPLVSELTVVDGKEVSIFNPVRQTYHFSQVGEQKVLALKENLKEFELEVNTIAKEFTSENIADFRSFITQYQPDLVILATATTDEYYLAEVLWQHEIPHIAMRCYPRAKWFEVLFVIPKLTPCFACLRGNIYTGTLPKLTPEQEARYDPNYDPLVLAGEPATKIDSERCSDIAVRISYELLRDKNSRWFHHLVNSKKNCLIGANRIESDKNGFCYGISLAGQVVAYGINDLKNNQEECLFCKRKISDFMKGEELCQTF